jgi:Domain of unknown function (DUF4105)
MDLLDWIIPAFLLTCAAQIVLWMAGAIYFDVAVGARWGRWLAAGWVSAVVLLFALWPPVWQPFVVLIGALALFLVWWRRQTPSNDRDWDVTVAVLPRAVRAGDAVTLENVRNFDYRSLNDYTIRYETRTYHLANLKGVDIIFFDWGTGLMCHPVLVFDFGPDGRLCMSIEARLCKGQKYSVIRGLYRQMEIIFVAADERDVILRRTKHSQGQKAYLYRLNTSIEELRQVFLDYVDALNRLRDTPQWYHVVYANCTTTFYQLPSTQWRWDWRVLVNGRLEDALYKAGRLDCTVAFPELQSSAYLNDIANDAPVEGFGDHIRRELERRRHERGRHSALEGA